MPDKIIILLFIGLSIGSIAYALTWNRFFSVFGVSIGGSVTGGVVSEIADRLMNFETPSLLIALLFSSIFITSIIVPVKIIRGVNFKFKQKSEVSNEYFKKLNSSVRQYRVETARRLIARG